ncbi:hypothetical protein EJB05_18035, partial [Eragrostis curvula]
MAHARRPAAADDGHSGAPHGAKKKMTPGATFCVLQAPFVRPGRHDDDFIGNGKPNQEQGNGDVDPSQHYDSDTLPGSDSPISGGSKRKSEDKQKKGKRAKFDYAAVQEVIDVMKNMSETMRFTHVTDPNEAIYKAIDDMLEYPLLTLLKMVTLLFASMLKGRPEEAIKQWVAQWVTSPCKAER